MRNMPGRHRGIDMVLAAVSGIDPKRRQVLLGDRGYVPYERPVLAIGAFSGTLRTPVASTGPQGFTAAQAPRSTGPCRPRTRPRVPFRHAALA
jgi:NADH dehydrogenase FAD-containing subunit